MPGPLSRIQRGAPRPDAAIEGMKTALATKVASLRDQGIISQKDFDNITRDRNPFAGSGGPSLMERVTKKWGVAGLAGVAVGAEVAAIETPNLHPLARVVLAGIGIAAGEGARRLANGQEQREERAKATREQARVMWETIVAAEQHRLTESTTDGLQDNLRAMEVSLFVRALEQQEVPTLQLISTMLIMAKTQISSSIRAAARIKPGNGGNGGIAGAAQRALTGETGGMSSTEAKTHVDELVTDATATIDQVLTRIETLMREKQTLYADGGQALRRRLVGLPADSAQAQISGGALDGTVDSDTANGANGVNGANSGN